MLYDGGRRASFPKRAQILQIKIAAALREAFGASSAIAPATMKHRVRASSS
jgi:hypothetical protein